MPDVDHGRFRWRAKSIRVAGKKRGKRRDRSPGAPRTRGECPSGRPCPWVGCRYHLALDVEASGTIQLRLRGSPFMEPIDAFASALARTGRPTCALDVAEAHPDGLPLEEIGDIMCIGRPRVLQIERSAFAKFVVRMVAGVDAEPTPENIERACAAFGIVARRRAELFPEAKAEVEPEPEPTEAHGQA